jgi:hypothetical protein
MGPGKPSGKRQAASFVLFLKKNFVPTLFVTSPMVIIAADSAKQKLGYGGHFCFVTSIWVLPG